MVDGSKVIREFRITEGKIQSCGGRGKKIIADYILVHKGIKLAVIEAKSDELEVGEGVMQAKKNTLEALASGSERILLTLATGTGKTAIAFQIAWKLFQTRWTVRQAHRPNEPARRPRILFLATIVIIFLSSFFSK